MEAPQLERKLVAILAADIEGFSRHIERDENGTLATLSSHRLVIDTCIAEHGGRITGTAGDSVLAEFASVISAVNCAVKIQTQLATENERLPPLTRLLLRIGINVGDVMVKDGDIFGDGVNIAARLESLAEPGGICVSRGVRDHLRKHRIVVFEDLGEQKVKNIAKPIRAFKVRIGETPPHDHPSDVAGSEPEPSQDPAMSAETVIDEAELALWNSVKDGGDQREFAIYLDRYPDGFFAELASSRRDALAAAGNADQISAPVEGAELAVEIAFWESAEKSGNVTELDAYLERYPRGQFVELARARSTALAEDGARTKADGNVDVEIAFWNSIKDSANPDKYRAYLAKYPDGSFADLARIELEMPRDAQHGRR